MDKEYVGNMHIKALYRMGDRDARRKFPRSVCIQFADKNYKDMVMMKIPVLRSKKSPIRIANHQPEELREKRKKLIYNRITLPKMWTRKPRETSWFLQRAATCTGTNWANVYQLARSFQVKTSKVQSLRIKK